MSSMAEMPAGTIKSPYNLKTGTFMSEPTTVNLTIGERVAAMRLFDAFKGSLATLAVLLEDVKAFAVTDEEWKEAELVKTPGQDGRETWNWQEGKVVKDITVQSATSEYLKSAIKAKSDAGEVTLADVALATLEKKLQ